MRKKQGHRKCSRRGLRALKESAWHQHRQWHLTAHRDAV